jgi:hypothetical protein
MEGLNNWWEVGVPPVATYLAYLFFKNKKLNLEFFKAKRMEMDKAAEVARKAQDTVAELTLELIEKDDQILELSGENAVLYRAVVNIHINCTACTQEEIDELPEKIKGKILNAINGRK